jgi:hypothetical protein
LGIVHKHDFRINRDRMVLTLKHQMYNDVLYDTNAYASNVSGLL